MSTTATETAPAVERAGRAWLGLALLALPSLLVGRDIDVLFLAPPGLTGS